MSELQQMIDAGEALQKATQNFMDCALAAIKTRANGTTNDPDAKPADPPKLEQEWLTNPRAQKSRPIDKLVIHSSATPAAMDIGAAEITEWHVKQRGFKAIGYHYVIRRSGAIEVGRSESAAGAHAKGHNARSIGVCLVGGARKRNGGVKHAENNFNKAQQATLARVVKEMRVKYPGLDIEGHRDLPGAKTSCPSFDVAAWLAAQD